MSMPPLTRGAGTITALSERRTHARRNVIDRRLVTISLDKKDAGLLVDVGEGGLCVQALGRIKPGVASSLHFELPDTGNRIEATGSVTWVDESGRAGIRFLTLADTFQMCLKDWLAREEENQAAEDSQYAPPAIPPALASGTMVTEIATLQREIAAQKLDQAAALNLILERARVLTRADGAAIALGNASGMVCRASSGTTAPPLGAQVQPDCGISGECVRTGLTIRCEDTELDPRVDVEACRALRLRSVIIVPLFSRGEVAGLLEVFYAKPRGFEGRDVLALRRIADLIAATIARDAVPEPELSGTARTTAEAGPPQRAQAADTHAPRPSPRAASRPGHVICDACGHENPEYARDCEQCDIPLRLPPPQEQEASPHPARVPLGRAAQARDSRIEAPFASFTRATQQTGTRPGIILRLTTKPRMLALLAVLLSLAGFLGWRQWHGRKQKPSSPARTTLTSPGSAPLLLPPAQAAPAPSVINPASSVGSEPAAARTLPSPSQDKGVRQALPEGGGKNSAAGKSSPFSPPPRRHSVLVPTQTAPAVSRQKATLSQPPPTATQQPAPAPRASGVIPARLISRVEPKYPEVARRRNVEGTVILRITVSRTGEVTEVQVLEGDDLLSQAAADAVRQWRYTPQMVDGRPSDSDTVVTLQFSLDKGD